MTYIITYPPSDAHTFNAVWTALHTLQEQIHVLRKWPQDIFMSLLTLVRGRDSSHDGLQPSQHDRDCPQANLALRQRIRDSHHQAGGYLPSYIGVGASLQKVNYRK
jgi:hypothetical protein